MTAGPSTWRPTEPARAPRLEAGDVHLWHLDLDDPARPLPVLEDLLDAHEHERAGRFVMPRDAMRYRSAHGQLRLLLAAYAAVNPASLRFTIGSTGKPTLLGDTAGHGLHFNLSHSGAHALVGISRVAEIGVDIECIRPVAELMDIAASNFALSECRALAAFDEPLRTEAFFACWTRKEAYVKALGEGLSLPLQDFEVSVDPAATVRLISVNGDGRAAEGWQLWAGRIDRGAWAAAAARSRSAQFHTLALR